MRRVSDPSQPDHTYGQYWPLERITELVAPSAADRQAVASYFHALGAVSVQETMSKDFLVVDIGVRELETAVEQDIFAFRHRASGRTLYRTHTHVKWPQHIQSRIDLITGVSDFAGQSLVLFL